MLWVNHGVPLRCIPGRFGLIPPGPTTAGIAAARSTPLRSVSDAVQARVTFDHAALGRERLAHRPLEAVHASNRVPVSTIRPLGVRIGEHRRLEWRPISESRWGAWARCDLTAPVPNSGSTCSSATMASSRSTNGCARLVPTEGDERARHRMDGDRGIASIVSTGW